MDHKRNSLNHTFILHRRDYSNSSLLLDCFCAEHGRFPAIAKGVRSKTRNQVSLLQPFQPLLMQVSGKGEVKTVTSFEQDGAAIVLQGQPLFCGLYLNELLQYLLGRFDPHQRLFHIYHQTLLQLNSSSSIDMVLRYFEIELLAELGYGLQLESDAETGMPIESEVFYIYQLEKGPIKAMAGGDFVIRGETLRALSNRELQLDDRGRQEAREMMRRILHHYLGGRPLKSRELFQTPISSKRAVSDA
jgi:DNA repair protein RecO (recombination protein O)